MAVGRPSVGGTLFKAHHDFIVFVCLFVCLFVAPGEARPDCTQDGGVSKDTQPKMGA